MEYNIPNPIKLRFNPEKSTNPLITKVFEDDIARTLYIGIKIGCLTDDNFPKTCLDTSEYIQKRGIPKSPKELEEIIYYCFPHHGEGYTGQDILEALFPYISGEKTLEYEVLEDKTP